MPFHVRRATFADVHKLAAVHVHAFNETHRGGRAGGPSQELREQQWREKLEELDDKCFCFVVEAEGGELVAFANGKPHDGGVPGFLGQLDKIYALRRVHRQGVGRLLLCAVARQFLAADVTSMLLFGEATNPANGFYERFGGERLQAGGEFHGAYGWRNLRALASKCDSE
jgi:ribosomal protein S18 acetylase RimI-like enzyme